VAAMKKRLFSKNQWNYFNQNLCCDNTRRMDKLHDNAKAKLVEMTKVTFYFPLSFFFTNSYLKEIKAGNPKEAYHLSLEHVSTYLQTL
jgi:hypothetical protein